MNPLFLLLVGVGVYFLVKDKGTPMPVDKRAWLKTLSTDAHWQDVVSKALDSEIVDMYALQTEYVTKQLQVPDGPLKQRLIAISSKYNIYT